MVVLDLARVEWGELRGGYRVPFDPRKLFAQLEAAPGDDKLWSAMVEELYHQGDVGDASYVSVVLFMCSERIVQALAWQMLNLVASIELARTAPQNPTVPEWLEEAYWEAQKMLGGVCVKTLEGAQEPNLVRGLLSVVALTKGLRVYATALLDYSEEEIELLLDGQWNA